LHIGGDQAFLISPRTQRNTESSTRLSERNLIAAMLLEAQERAFALFPPLAQVLANAMLT